MHASKFIMHAFPIWQEIGRALWIMHALLGSIIWISCILNGPKRLTLTAYLTKPNIVYTILLLLLTLE